MNKAVLLKLQQDKAKAMSEVDRRSKEKQVYDNNGYEDSEISNDPAKAPPEYNSIVSTGRKSHVGIEEEESERL